MTNLVSCGRCRNILAPEAPVCMRCGERNERSAQDCPFCDQPTTRGARFCAQCGRELTSSVPDVGDTEPPSGIEVTTTPLPFVSPWKPTPRTRLTVMAVVAALVISVAAFVTIQQTVYSPEAALQGYFDALIQRDADAAQSNILPVSTGGDGLLSTAVLTSSEYSPPSDLKVGIVNEDSNPDNRKAFITYRIGDGEHKSTVTLSRRKGREFGLFRGWLLAERSTLQVTTSAVVPVRINGLVLSSEAAEIGPDTGVILRADAFPGRYSVAIADNPLLEGESATVDVDTSGASVTLKVRAKDSAQTTIEGKVKEYLDSCAASGQNTQTNCPFSQRVPASVTDAKWMIESYPTIVVTLVEQQGRFAVSTTKPGHASVTGKNSSGAPYQNSVSFGTNGTAALEGANVAFLSN